MTDSIKTNALSTLPQVTAPQSTDIIPIGADKGATWKKSTFSNFQTAILADLDAYVLLEATSVSVSTSAIATGSSSGKIDTTFERNEKAGLCIPVMVGGGYLTCTSASVAKDVLTTYFLNATSTTHTGGAKFMILQSKKIG